MARINIFPVLILIGAFAVWTVSCVEHEDLSFPSQELQTKMNETENHMAKFGATINNPHSTDKNSTITNSTTSDNNGTVPTGSASSVLSWSQFNILIILPVLKFIMAAYW